MNKRSNWMCMLVIPVLLLFWCVLSGCGQSQAATQAGTLPRGVMTAAQACTTVLGKADRGFFTDPEQVHLVLTSYAKGEPAESGGDISTGMPPQTLVWIVDVHAKAINWDHSVPPGYQGPAHPDTDYSVVMNARTGYVPDQGECACWPLPLSTAGTLVSLSPKC